MPLSRSLASSPTLAFPSFSPLFSAIFPLTPFLATLTGKMGEGGGVSLFHPQLRKFRPKAPGRRSPAFRLRTLQSTGSFPRFSRRSPRFTRHCLCRLRGKTKQAAMNSAGPNFSRPSLATNHQPRVYRELRGATAFAPRVRKFLIFLKLFKLTPLFLAFLIFTQGEGEYLIYKHRSLQTGGGCTDPDA